MPDESGVGVANRHPITGWDVLDWLVMKVLPVMLLAGAAVEVLLL